MDIRPALRRLLVVLVLALAGVGTVLTSAAWGHTDLVSSYPAAGSRVAEPPDQVSLEFAAPLVLGDDGLVLRGPSGEVLAASVLGSATGEVYLAVLDEGDPPSGPWTVEYDGLSRDGHRVVGAIDFVAGPGAVRAHGGTRPAGDVALGVALLLVTAAAAFRLLVGRGPEGPAGGGPAGGRPVGERVAP